jgi:hypothetical protein
MLQPFLRRSTLVLLRRAQTPRLLKPLVPKPQTPPQLAAKVGILIGFTSVIAATTTISFTKSAPSTILPPTKKTSSSPSKTKQSTTATPPHSLRLIFRAAQLTLLFGPPIILYPITLLFSSLTDFFHDWFVWSLSTAGPHL